MRLRPDRRAAGRSTRIFHAPAASLYARSCSARRSSSSSRRAERRPRPCRGGWRWRRCLSVRESEQGLRRRPAAVRPARHARSKRRRRRQLRPPSRRDPRHRRRERLGQDDARPADPAHRRADRGHDRYRRSDGSERSMAALPLAGSELALLSPRRPAGLPGPVRLAQSAHDRAQIIGDPLHRQRHRRRPRALEDRVAVAHAPRRASIRSAMERYPARLLRRPAPAHRHRPGARARSRGHRRRRGDLGARRLDPRQILDLLLDIRSGSNLSYIFISHDISVVRYFCDRVAVMHRGRIVEIGDAEQICTARGGLHQEPHLGGSEP